MNKDESMKDYIKIEIEKMENEINRVESTIKELNFRITGAKLIIKELKLNIVGHEEQLAQMDKKIVTPTFPKERK